MLQRVSLQDARQTRNCWLKHTCVLALTSLSGLNSKTTNRHHEYWGYPEKTLQTRLSPSALLFASAIKTRLMTSRFRFCVQLIRQTFPPLAMWVIETICTIFCITTWHLLLILFSFAVTLWKMFSTMFKPRETHILCKLQERVRE